MNESLSRVLTLTHFLSAWPCSSSEVIVYLLGSDDKDVLDPEQLSQHLSPAIRNLSLYMIGPHMKPLSRRFHAKSGAAHDLTIDTIGKQGLYHEIHTAELPSPHYICIFNGGLWGYDSWIPTLRSLNDLTAVYVMVTSYTLEEAEDDYDTVLEHCKASVTCVWEPQINPYRSTVSLPRQTQPGNREYFDNFAYQCFRF